jgi:signal transduction histidine kinase
MAAVTCSYIHDHTFHVVNGYLALTAVLFNFTFALLAMFRTSRETVYVTFAFLCLSVMYWNFGDFMLFVSGFPLFPPAGEGSPSSWYYLSSAGGSLAVAFLFHFVNALVATLRRNRGWIAVSYACGLFLALMTTAAPLDPGLKKQVDGITWNVLFLLTLLPFIVWSLVLLLRAARRSPSEDEQIRYRYIGASILITVVAGVSDVVQIMRVPVPPLGHIGSIIGPSILAVGVLKHRHAYDLLAQTQMRLELLGQMAASITHEIGNPLGAIKGALSLQRREMEGKPYGKAGEYHGIIAEEIARLESILAEFRDFTRPLRVEKQPVRINELVNRTLKLAEMGHGGLSLVREPDPEAGEIQADPSLLRQVFLNLIRNAAEACGPGGKLTIRTEHLHPGARIVFADDGPGIPPDLAGRIFEPFFSTKSGGMGLGLAICKRIVEAHGGTIAAGAASPTGATFTITLPG